MWKYIQRYLGFAVIAGLFMVGEVLMDLIQPGFMSRIVDDGVLGISNGGTSDLALIWTLGLQMIGLVLFGGLCGSLNNVFVHISSQNIGNEIRKDCFRQIMTFSFPQIDRFGAGSLVTRVTNDITQIQSFVSLFVRGLIRTSLLTFGSIYCIFRLNLHFGLIVLCAFPFLVGCIAFCLYKANPLFSRLQAQLDSINAIMQEDVSGIRIIKACVRETYEKIRFGKANGELIRTQLKTLTIFAFMNPTVNALMYLGDHRHFIYWFSRSGNRRRHAGKRHGGDHLYHAAAQRRSDAGDAVPEYFQRNPILETGQGGADQRAAAYGRLL